MTHICSIQTNRIEVECEWVLDGKRLKRSTRSDKKVLKGCWQGPGWIHKVVASQDVGLLDILLPKKETDLIDCYCLQKVVPKVVLSHNYIPIASNPATMCKHTPIDGFPFLFFESQDISMLISLTACVNDICINRCILLLFFALNISANNDFAVFSTHHLMHICYHASDHVLWKSTIYINFWMKDIWIISIHWLTAAHWVLCIACLSWWEL